MTTENKNKGIFKIEFTETGSPAITFHPIDGNIWLNRPELIELFDITMPKLNSHIKAVYQSEAFGYEDTAKYSLQANSRGIKYEATEFNLSVIMALAFRINTWQAKRIRDWFVKMAIRGHFSVNFPKQTTDPDFYLN